MALTSCQPPDRDIRVVWRGDFLAIDFPWSLWRLVGLQDRKYCVSEIELFDKAKVLWRQKIRRTKGHWVDCIDVRMPIKLHKTLPGFEGSAFPKLVSGTRYGIGIRGLGDGRVDFIASGREDDPINISGWDKVMQGPCGGWWAREPC